MGRPTGGEEAAAASLPAGLVFWSQPLRWTAHLREALRLRARGHAHPAFLWLFDLGQDVPDLPLGQLDNRSNEKVEACHIDRHQTADRQSQWLT